MNPTHTPQPRRWLAAVLCMAILALVGIAATTYSGGRLTSVDADEALAAYRLVVSGSDVNHVAYPDTLQERPLGITRAAASSSGYADVSLLGSTAETLIVRVAGTAALGDWLTPQDPATDSTGMARPVPDDVGLYWLVGHALQAGTDTDIAMVPVPPRVAARGHANTADSDTVSNTAGASTFSTGTVTVAGATLQAGDRIRVSIHGVVIDNNGTDTMSLTISMGTATILETTAVDVADNDEFRAEVDMVVKTAGASGVIRADGHYVLGVPGTAVPTPATLAETALDTTGDISLTVQCHWDAAHADNEVVLEALTVEPRRPGL